MTITTFSSRALARDASAIKRAAAEGTVFFTDRGKPVLAVMNIEDYHRLAGGAPEPSLLDLMMSLPGTGDVDLEAVLPDRKAFPAEARIPDFGEGG